MGRRREVKEECCGAKPGRDEGRMQVTRGGGDQWPLSIINASGHSKADPHARNNLYEDRERQKDKAYSWERSSGITVRITREYLQLSHKDR